MMLILFIIVTICFVDNVDLALYNLRLDVFALALVYFLNVSNQRCLKRVVIIMTKHN